MNAPIGIAEAVAALPTAWRTRAAEFRAWGAAANAETLERAAEELARALDTAGEARVSLEEAARVSGYAADSLRHLVRAKKLAAERRGRRLFFRLADLPRKAPARVDGPRLVAYDPVADARKVAGERVHGG